MDHFERFVGVDTRQAVGVRQGPVVDETVVARGALEVHAHEDLGDVLRRLHLGRLAGIDHAPPDDAVDEARRRRLGIDQLPHELIEGQVLRQRAVEPAVIWRRPPSM